MSDPQYFIFFVFMLNRILSFIMFIFTDIGKYWFLLITFSFKRKGKGGRKRRIEPLIQEKHHVDWVPLARPQPGAGPPPRHVPGPGIESATRWSAGQHSVHCSEGCSSLLSATYRRASPSLGRLLSWPELPPFSLHGYYSIRWARDLSHGLLLYLKDFIYVFLERGEGREKQRERNIDVWKKHQLVASHACPNRRPGPQPRHVPDQESNQRLFALRDNVQPTESQASQGCPRAWMSFYFWSSLTPKQHPDSKGSAPSSSLRWNLC